MELAQNKVIKSSEMNSWTKLYQANTNKKESEDGNIKIR